jgi:hypothetical protein
MNRLKIIDLQKVIETPLTMQEEPLRMQEEMEALRHRVGPANFLIIRFKIGKGAGDG